MRKWLWGIVIGLVLAAALGLLSVSAAEIVESGTCGTDLTWTLDSEKVLTISGSGVMYDYEQKGAPWYSSRADRVNTINIEDGVTSIGSWAFYGLRPQEVNISDTVKRIGHNTFYECQSLQTITLPDSIETIGVNAFYNCALKDFSLPPNLTYVGSRAFYGDSADELIIPGTLQTIGDRAFEGCRVKRVVIEEGVRRIGDCVFSNCTSLQQITIPDTVTYIGSSSFENCTSLGRIEIPGAITEIRGYAFNNCTSLTSIVIPGTVTWIQDNAFYGCQSLEFIVFRGEEEQWNAVTVYDGNSVIDEASVICSAGALVSIQLTSGTAGDDLAWVLYADGRFVLSGEGSCPDYYYDAPWYSFSRAICFLEVEEGVSNIGDYAFTQSTSMSFVTFPESLRVIGGRAFENCGLLSVEVPEGVTTIGGGAFRCCGLMKSIKLPASVTSIGNLVFNLCYDLSFIQVNDNNPAYCSDTEGVLYDKEVKQLISYPIGRQEDEYTIPEGVVEIGPYSLQGCETIKILSIPSSLERVGQSGLNGTDIDRINICDLAAWCNVDVNENSVLDSFGKGELYVNGTLLEELIIPDSVSVINPYVFEACKCITSVTIPEGVTVIGKGVFENCSNMKTITIPKSVNRIGQGCFWNCNNLRKLVFAGDAPSIESGSDVFGNLDRSRIHVICYEGNEGWNNSYWSGFSLDIQHLWGEWEILQEPTEEESGFRKRVCCYCDLEEEEYFDTESYTGLPRLRVPQIEYERINVYGMNSSTPTVGLTVLSTTGEDITEMVSISILNPDGEPARGDIFGLRYDSEVHGFIIGGCAYSGDYTIVAEPVEGLTAGNSRSAVLHIERDYSTHVSLNSSDLNSAFIFNVVYGSGEEKTLQMRIVDQFWDPYTLPIVFELSKDNGNTLQHLEGGVHKDEETGTYVIEELTGLYGITVDLATNTLHVAHDAIPGNYVLGMMKLSEVEEANQSGGMVQSLVEIGRRMTVTRTTANFTIQFLDEDNSVISTRSYPYKSGITLPANPTKPSDGANVYEFAGWSPEVSETCEGEATYTAQYDSYALESIEIINVPDKTTYIEGEEFDRQGMVVKATYENGQSELVTDYTVSPASALTQDDEIVQVSFYGKTADQPVYVEEAPDLEGDGLYVNEGREKVIIKVDTNENHATSVYTAFYDENGRMISMKYKELEDNTTKVLSFALPENTTYVKAFLLDDSQEPVQNNYDLDLL